MDTVLMLLLLPLFLIQFALMIWAIVKIIPKTETKYLSKPIWLVIIILVSMFGPIAYLVLEGDE